MTCRHARSRHAALALIASLATAHGAITRTEFGSPPLRWNLDTFLADWVPDQNPATLAIRFRLGTTVSRRGVQADEWNAVRAAFAQWASVPGTKVRFEESTPVPNPSTVSALDGVNQVVWLPQGTYGQGDLGERIAFGSGTLALTVIALDFDENGQSSGTVIEADTIINREFDYHTDYEASTAVRPFLESVMLHEIGHWLGMNHSPLGAATLFWFQGAGIGAGAGLSSDDLSFARSMYGLPGTLASLGTVSGTVRSGGAAVRGALVALETPDGFIAAGTASEADGSFRIPGITPGTYRLRVYPADPNSGGDASLVRGAELDVSAGQRFAAANTAFLPRTEPELTLAAGATVSRTVNVTAGNPAFRIVETRTGFDPAGRASGDLPLLLPQGGSNLWVGVFVPGSLPANPPPTLRVTGPGLTHGTTTVHPAALRQLSLIQVPVTVAPDARPGLRSIELTAGGFTASAVGFVDVAPIEPDFNFDGLDDRFQRRYFAPWTKPEAAPEADPDGDGFVNRREKTMGSVPTDPKSVSYRLTRIRMTTGGTAVTWESAPGRRYQLWSREELGGSWSPVGSAVAANGESTEATDPRPAAPNRFYRVSDAP